MPRVLLNINPKMLYRFFKSHPEVSKLKKATQIRMKRTFNRLINLRKFALITAGVHINLENFEIA